MLNILEEKRKFQLALSSHLGKPVMTKLKLIDMPDANKRYSMYYAKLGCLLCVDDRYIVAIVQDDGYPIGTQQYISDLNWISFQTRTLDQKQVPGQIKSQDLKTTLNPVVTDKIQMVERKEDRMVYFSNTHPVQVELLFTKDYDTYAENGTIQSALETYNCVLTFTL
jgi:hypothetical protein